MPQKKHIALRLISAILVITFIAQDICWAYPDVFSSQRTSNNKLAPSSLFAQNNSPDKVYAKIIDCVIEKEVTKSKGESTLAVVCAAVKNYLNSAGQFKNNVKCIVRFRDGSAKGLSVITSPIARDDISEILVSVTPGYMIRYYNPSANDPPTAGIRNLISEIKLSDNLSKQLLKINALPEPAKSIASEPGVAREPRYGLAKDKEPSQKILDFKTVAAMAAIIGTLFFVLQFFVPSTPINTLIGAGNVPGFMSHTNLRTILSFTTFVPLGHSFGQYINLKKEDRPLKGNFKFVPIFTTIGLTLFIFSWFWPFTYSLWLGSIPHYSLGIADQMVTAPSSVSVLFLTNGFIDKYLSKGKKDHRSIIKTVFQEEFPRIRESLGYLFPYWGMGLAIIFNIPLNFAIQTTCVSLLNPPSAIILFYILHRKIDKDNVKSMKPWAKIVLPLALAYNLLYFPHHVSVFTLIPGAILYYSTLYFGFQNGRSNGKNVLRPQVEPVKSGDTGSHNRLSTSGAKIDLSGTRDVPSWENIFNRNLARKIMALYPSDLSGNLVLVKDHAIRVSRIVYLLALKLGLDERDTTRLVDAALLHDVGKVYNKKMRELTRQSFNPQDMPPGAMREFLATYPHVSTTAAEKAQIPVDLQTNILVRFQNTFDQSQVNREALGTFAGMVERGTVDIEHMALMLQILVMAETVDRNQNPPARAGRKSLRKMLSSPETILVPYKKLIQDSLLGEAMQKVCAAMEELFVSNDDPLYDILNETEGAGDGGSQSSRIQPKDEEILGYEALDSAKILFDEMMALKKQDGLEPLGAVLLGGRIQGLIRDVALLNLDSIVTKYDKNFPNGSQSTLELRQSVAKAAAKCSMAHRLLAVMGIEVKMASKTRKKYWFDSELRNISDSIRYAVRALKFDEERAYAPTALEEALVTLEFMVEVIASPRSLEAADIRRGHFAHIAKNLESAMEMNDLDKNLRLDIRRIRAVVEEKIVSLGELRGVEGALPGILRKVITENFADIEELKELTLLEAQIEHGKRFADLLEPFLGSRLGDVSNIDETDKAIIRVLLSESVDHEWKVKDLLKGTQNAVPREELERRVAKGYPCLGLEPTIISDKAEGEVVPHSWLACRVAKSNVESHGKKLEDLEDLLKRLGPWLAPEQCEHFDRTLTQVKSAFELFREKVDLIPHNNKFETREKQSAFEANLAAFYNGGNWVEGNRMGTSTGYIKMLDRFERKVKARISEVPLPRIAKLQQVFAGCRNRIDNLCRMAPEMPGVQSLRERLLGKYDKKTDETEDLIEEGQDDGEVQKPKCLNDKMNDLTNKRRDDYIFIELYADLSEQLSDIGDELDVLEAEAQRFKRANDISGRIRSMDGFFVSDEDRAAYQEAERSVTKIAEASPFCAAVSSEDMPEVRPGLTDESVVQTEGIFRNLSQRREELRLMAAYPAFLAIAKFLFSERMRLANLDEQYQVSSDWKLLNEAENIVYEILTADLSSGENKPWREKIRRLGDILYTLVFESGYKGALSRYINDTMSPNESEADAELRHAREFELKVPLNNERRRQTLAARDRIGRFGFFRNGNPQPIRELETLAIYEVVTGPFLSGVSLPDVPESACDNFGKVPLHQKAVAAKLSLSEQETAKILAGIGQYFKIFTNFAGNYSLEAYRSTALLQERDRPSAAKFERGEVLVADTGEDGVVRATTYLPAPDLSKQKAPQRPLPKEVDVAGERASLLLRQGGGRTLVEERIREELSAVCGAGEDRTGEITEYIEKRLKNCDYRNTALRIIMDSGMRFIYYPPETWGRFMQKMHIDADAIMDRKLETCKDGTVIVKNEEFYYGVDDIERIYCELIIELLSIEEAALLGITKMFSKEEIGSLKDDSYDITIAWIRLNKEPDAYGITRKDLIHATSEMVRYVYRFGGGQAEEKQVILAVDDLLKRSEDLHSRFQRLFYGSRKMIMNLAVLLSFKNILTKVGAEGRYYNTSFSEEEEEFASAINAECGMSTDEKEYDESRLISSALKGDDIRQICIRSLSRDPFKSIDTETGVAFEMSLEILPITAISPIPIKALFNDYLKDEITDDEAEKIVSALKAEIERSRGTHNPATQPRDRKSTSGSPEEAVSESGEGSLMQRLASLAAAVDTSGDPDLRESIAAIEVAAQMREEGVYGPEAAFKINRKSLETQKDRERADAKQAALKYIADRQVTKENGFMSYRADDGSAIILYGDLLRWCDFDKKKGLKAEFCMLFDMIANGERVELLGMGPTETRRVIKGLKRLMEDDTFNEEDLEICIEEYITNPLKKIRYPFGDKDERNILLAERLKDVTANGVQADRRSTAGKPEEGESGVFQIDASPNTFSSPAVKVNISGLREVNYLNVEVEKAQDDLSGELSIEEYHALIEDILRKDQHFIAETIKELGIGDKYVYTPFNVVRAEAAYSEVGNNTRIYRVNLYSSDDRVEFVLALGQQSRDHEESKRTHLSDPDELYTVKGEFDNLRRIYRVKPENVVKVCAYTETICPEFPRFGAYSSRYMKGYNAVYPVMSRKDGVYRITSAANVGSLWQMEGKDYQKFVKDLLKLEIELYIKNGEIYNLQAAQGDLMYTSREAAQAIGPPYSLGGQFLLKTVEYDPNGMIVLASVRQAKKVDRPYMVCSLFEQYNVVIEENGAIERMAPGDICHALRDALEELYPGEGSQKTIKWLGEALDEWNVRPSVSRTTIDFLKYYVKGLKRDGGSRSSSDANRDGPKSTTRGRNSTAGAAGDASGVSQSDTSPKASDASTVSAVEGTEQRYEYEIPRFVFREETTSVSIGSYLIVLESAATKQRASEGSQSRILEVANRLKTSLELLKYGRNRGHEPCLGCINNAGCPVVTTLLEGRDSAEPDDDCGSSKRCGISDKELGLALNAVGSFLEDMAKIGNGSENVTPKRQSTAGSPQAAKTREQLFQDFISSISTLGQSLINNLSAITTVDSLSDKAIILYADNILEQGAAVDLEDVLSKTHILDNSTMIVYGKKPGTAGILERIIKEANSSVKVLTVEPRNLKERFNNAQDLDVEYPDETKELDCLIRYARANNLNNGKLLGVIKGRTEDIYKDGINALLSEYKVPVASFKSDSGIYSFREALNMLISIKNMDGPTNNGWFKLLPPIQKLSDEFQKAYDNYKRALGELMASA